jgi:hypothetical protein
MMRKLGLSDLPSLVVPEDADLSGADESVWLMRRSGVPRGGSGSQLPCEETTEVT